MAVAAIIIIFAPVTAGAANVSFSVKALSPCRFRIALHVIMSVSLVKWLHSCRCLVALAALYLMTLASANIAASIPAPSAFQAVADARWTPQYRLAWKYSDTIDYLYFEVARNCSDGRSVFIRVDDKAMTDYFDIKSLRCTYAVRAVSLASFSPFSPSVTVGFGGLPSAPRSIESVLPTKANTLQVQITLFLWRIPSARWSAHNVHSAHSITFLQVRYTAVDDAGSGDRSTVSIVNYRVEYR